MKKYLFLLSICFLPLHAMASETCQGVILDNISECGGHHMGEKIDHLHPRLADPEHNPTFYVTDQKKCLWPAPKIRLLNCHIIQKAKSPFYDMSLNELSQRARKQQYLKIHHLLTYQKDSDLSMADASDLTGKYLENPHSHCGQKVAAYMADHEAGKVWNIEKWQAEPCPVSPISILTGQNKGMFSNR